MAIFGIAWWNLRRHSFWKKSFAAALTAVFVFTVVSTPLAEANFWQERQRAHTDRRQEKQASLLASRSDSRLSNLPLAGLDLPEKSGAITETYWPPVSLKSDLAQPLVIHLQDAHGVFAAQKNAADIVSHFLHDTPPVTLVAVEGAWGELNTRWFSSFPQEDLRDSLAAVLLREGDISGEEYLAVTQPANGLSLFGVEDAELYFANNAAREETREDRRRVLAYLRGLTARLDQLKPRVFNRTLLELDRLSAAHGTQTLPLKEYAQGLRRFWGDELPAAYPNARKILELVSLEKNLDSARIEGERRRLVETLGRTAPEDTLSALLSAAMDYRMGRLSPRQYHRMLLSAAQTAGVPCPELDRFVRYLEKYETLDLGLLSAELENLTEALGARLATRPLEKRLIQADRWIALKEKLWSLEMSPQEWAVYPQRNTFDSWQTVETHLAEMEAAAGVTVAASDEWVSLRPVIRRAEPLAERFFELALRRNNALVQNTLAEARRRKASRVILIAGGFHTPGLARLLRQEGASYVVVRPRLDRDNAPFERAERRDTLHSFLQAVKTAHGALRTASRFQDLFGRQTLAAELLGLTALSLSPEETEKLADDWLSRLSSADDDTVANVAIFPRTFIRRGQTYVLGAIQGRKARLPFVLWNEGTAQEPRLRALHADADIRRWMAEGPAEVSDLAVEERRGLGVRLKRMWPHLLEKDDALPAFLGLPPDPTAKVETSASSARSADLPAPSAPRSPRLSLGRALVIGGVVLAGAVIVSYLLFPGFFQNLLHALAAKSPVSLQLAGLFGTVIVTAGGQTVDTYKTAYASDKDTQKQVLSQLIAEKTSAAHAAAEEIIQLLQAMDDKRAAELYGELAPNQKKALLIAFDAHTIGRLLNGRAVLARTERLDALRTRRAELSVTLADMKRILADLKTGKRPSQELLKKTLAPQIEELEDDIAEHEDLLAEYSTLIDGNTIPRIGNNPPSLKNQAETDKQNFQAELQDMKRRLQSLQRGEVSVDQIRKQMSDLEKHLALINDEINVFRYPAISLTPAQNSERVEALIAAKIQEEVEFIQKTLYARTDGETKLNRIWDVFKGAQAVTESIEFESGLVDLSAKAARDIADGVPAPAGLDKLPEYNSVLPHIYRSLRQRTNPAIAVSIPTDKAKAPLNYLMARRLLEDARYRPTHKRQKILSLSFKNLPQGGEQAVERIKELLRAAHQMGDTAIVLDLDIFPAFFLQRDVEALDNILGYWQGLPNPPPLVAFGSPNTQEVYLNHSQFYPLVFSERQDLALSADTQRTLLGMEAAEIEKFNDIRIPAEIVSTLLKRVLSSGPFNLAMAIRVLQEAASEAEARGRDELSENEVLKAVADLPAAENLPLEERFRHLAEQMPERARQIARQQLERLKRLPPNSPERGVITNYLENLVQIPWTKRSAEETDLGKVRDVLERSHFGMKEAKEQVLDYIAERTLAAKKQGKIICWVGPPGVGKSTLAETVARATGREFVRVSLGGVRDEAEIRGHRRTYIGAMPGIIVKGLQKSKSRNPVFLLDEVDKMSSDSHGDPVAALMQVLDPKQNHEFQDHYMEVGVDLSEVMFILTANDLNTIPGPLLDRMEIVQLPGYTPNEKIVIGRDYTLPRIAKTLGLTETQVRIPDPTAVVETLVDGYTQEAGARQLENRLRKILVKVLHEWSLNRRSPVVLTPAKVAEYLGAPREGEKIREEDTVGEAVGLAWTPVGGEILYVQSTLLDTGDAGRELSVDITGNLMDTMKESAALALSVARNKMRQWGLNAARFNGKRIFVHVPQGSIPKDGPSAGITFVTSILSELSGRPVRSDVAMTGEVDAKGNVLPIGGLKEKLLAARKAGVKTVFVPLKNRGMLIDDVFKTVPELRGVLESRGRQTLFVPKMESDGEWKSFLQELRRNRPKGLTRRDAEDGITLAGDRNAMREFLKRFPQLAGPLTYVLAEKVEDVLEQALLPSKSSETSPTPSAGSSRSRGAVSLPVLFVLAGLAALVLLLLPVWPILMDWTQSSLAFAGTLSPAKMSVLTWPLLIGGVAVSNLGNMNAPAGAQPNVPEETKTQQLRSLLDAGTPDGLKTAKTFLQTVWSYSQPLAGKLFDSFANLSRYRDRLLFAFDPQTLGRLLFATRLALREDYLEQRRSTVLKQKELLEKFAADLSQAESLSPKNRDAFLAARRTELLAFLEEDLKATETEAARLRNILKQQKTAGRSPLQAPPGSFSPEEMLKHLNASIENAKKTMSLLKNDPKEALAGLQEQLKRIEEGLGREEREVLDLEFPQMSRDPEEQANLLDSYLYTRVIERMQEILKAFDPHKETRAHIQIVWDTYVANFYLHGLENNGLVRDISKSISREKGLTDVDELYRPATDTVVRILGQRTERALTLVAPSLATKGPLA
ncbi:MAG TPA: endopeptidase La, partial [Elusimicrobiota bacterium]|nr:endopeptidase La [Elusimicrobiota bacterium]